MCGHAACLLHASHVKPLHAVCLQQSWLMSTVYNGMASLSGDLQV